MNAKTSFDKIMYIYSLTDMTVSIDLTNIDKLLKIIIYIITYNVIIFENTELMNWSKLP